jgi:hypothetical protein
MIDRQHLIQYAAGVLASSAFIATTQILAAPTLDLPLYIALVAFAVNIPFQIFVSIMPISLTIKEALHLRATSQGLSRPQCLQWLIQLLSTPAILIGFVAMFCHFAWWLGVLFALTALAAHCTFRYCATEHFKQHPEEYK